MRKGEVSSRICALDHVEYDPVRILDVKFSWRVRPDRHQRAPRGLEPRERGCAIGHAEGRYYSVVRRGRIAKEVELESTVGERDAVRRAIEYHATQYLGIELFGGRGVGDV